MTRYDAVNFISTASPSAPACRNRRPSAVRRRRSWPRRRPATKAQEVGRCAGQLTASTSTRRPRRQDRSADRPRGGGQPHHPGAVPPSKNNPLSSAIPGVGKTAIAEGLAARSSMAKCPKCSPMPPIFRSTWASLLAGTRYRGDFEERLKQVVKEIEAIPARSVHRRDPHRHRRRRHLRRRDGCLQPAQAGAVLRRAALHRLDHLQGIPPVLREGPRAGAPVPEDRRQRADVPMRSRSSRAQALFRGLSQGQATPTMRSRRRWNCRRATSTTASCRTRPST
jgi:hypothetical protein